MEKRRVVITGLGTVNPLGNNTADSWAAARAGKCGIGPITQFDASEFKCKLAGEVKGFDPETVVDKKEARKMARFTLLALALPLRPSRTAASTAKPRPRTSALSCPAASAVCPPSRSSTAAARKRAWRRSAPTLSRWLSPTWRQHRSPSASASRGCVPAR